MLQTETSFSTFASVAGKDVQFAGFSEMRMLQGRQLVQTKPPLRFQDIYFEKSGAEKKRSRKVFCDDTDLAFPSRAGRVHMNYRGSEGKEKRLLVVSTRARPSQNIVPSADTVK